MESFVIRDGAQCNNIANDLEEAFPGIVAGKMEDLNLAILIAYNGFDKSVSSRGKSRSALRPGEYHGRL